VRPITAQKESDMTKPKRPDFTWAFEEGRLTVHHLGKTVSLGRYADRALAAKAAARYLAEHGEKALPPAPAPSAPEAPLSLTGTESN
jgi:hypothetical protein